MHTYNLLIKQVSRKLLFSQSSSAINFTSQISDLKKITMNSVTFACEFVSY